MSKSACELSTNKRFIELSSKTNSKNRLLLKDSSRTHKTECHLSLNPCMSEKEKIPDFEIRTEPLHDFQNTEEKKSSIILFNRNYQKDSECELIKKESLEKNKKPLFLEIPSPEINQKSVFTEKSSVANCLICCDKPPNAVFMDCGHGG